jgi:hypothetical protein
MRKITDDDYILPIIEALSPHELFESGANKPLLITGVDANGIKGDYVVKFRSAERMSFEASMRELLAAFIAMQMEITVVRPVIINVSQDFADLLKGHEAWQYANRSIGYNYGSEYIKDHSTLIINQSLNNNQLPYAQNIFAFDILIQNTDRRDDKPNMITDGKEIIIFDHELAFGFVFDLFKNPRPWEITARDMEWINNHCLLSKIKGNNFNFDTFSKRLDNLDENFWNTAWNIIPDEWRSDHFNLIKNHFSAISENKDAFILELKKLMS